MNIGQLQELKQKLTNKADLSNIWLFYMDHFADHAEFTDLGEPAYNEYLDGVIQKTCNLYLAPGNSNVNSMTKCQVSEALNIL
jgi:hypothetical protein